MADVAPIIKENGTPQRNDVSLTADIAATLRDMVLAGDVLYPKEVKELTLMMGEGDEKKPFPLLVSQIHGWVSRDNVIPGINRTLRDYLQEARMDYRNAERERRQEEIVENAEKSLQALVNMPTAAPKKVLTRFKFHKASKKFIKTSRVEEETKGHDSKLIEVKSRALMFGLERLDPQRYGARVDVKNTHLHFSLGDLRRAKERRDELAPA